MGEGDVDGVNRRCVQGSRLNARCECDNAGVLVLGKECREGERETASQGKARTSCVVWVVDGVRYEGGGSDVQLYRALLKQRCRCE